MKAHVLNANFLPIPAMTHALFTDCPVWPLKGKCILKRRIFSLYKTSESFAKTLDHWVPPLSMIQKETLQWFLSSYVTLKSVSISFLTSSKSSSNHFLTGQNQNTAFSLYFLLQDKHRALTVTSLWKHTSDDASWNPSGRHYGYRNIE